jgi:hypothetical protein
MRKDTCRHCGNDVERTEELSASAIGTGGFLCAGCLVGYRMLCAVPYGEHRGSRALDADVPESLRKAVA